MFNIYFKKRYIYFKKEFNIGFKKSLILFINFNIYDDVINRSTSTVPAQSI